MKIDDVFKEVYKGKRYSCPKDKEIVQAFDIYAIDFARWLEENTRIIYEEKITLYKYYVDDQWANYTLEDIYTEYKDKNS